MNDYADPLINAKQALKLLEDSLLHRNYHTAIFAAEEVKKEVDRLIQWVQEKK